MMRRIAITTNIAATLCLASSTIPPSFILRYPIRTRRIASTPVAAVTTTTRTKIIMPMMVNMKARINKIKFLSTQSTSHLSTSALSLSMGKEGFDNKGDDGDGDGDGDREGGVEANKSDINNGSGNGSNDSDTSTAISSSSPSRAWKPPHIEYTHRYWKTHLTEERNNDNDCIITTTTNINNNHRLVVDAAVDNGHDLTRIVELLCQTSKGRDKGGGDSGGTVLVCDVQDVVLQRAMERMRMLEGFDWTIHRTDGFGNRGRWKEMKRGVSIDWHLGCHADLLEGLVSSSSSSSSSFTSLSPVVSLVVFNLGYLPGSNDRKIATRTDTTLRVLRSACHLVQPGLGTGKHTAELEGVSSLEDLGGGDVSVILYPGRIDDDGVNNNDDNVEQEAEGGKGKEEESAVLEYASELEGKDWLVRHVSWINRKEGSPSVMIIQRIRRD